MSRSLAVLSILVTLCLPAGTAAESEERRPDAVAVPSDPETAATVPEGEQSGVATDRFEPTERISEDLSVAFPVDI